MTYKKKKIYKNFTKAHYTFSVNNSTWPSDDPLSYRKNSLEMTVHENIQITDMKIILPAYLGPQDVPRTSSSNFPRTSPKYPFWPFWGCPNLTFWGRPNLTFWGRPEKISRRRSNLMFNERPWDVDSGPPQNFLKTSPRRSTEYSNFFNFSFRIYSIDQIYLRAFQHSNCIENPVKLLIWSIFCKISYLIFSH